MTDRVPEMLVELDQRLKRLRAVADAATDLLVHDGPCDDKDHTDDPYCPEPSCVYCRLGRAVEGLTYDDLHAREDR